MELLFRNDGFANGETNMRIDSELLDSYKISNSPILRVYGWSPYAVSYGYHQPVTDFNIDAIEQAGYGLVRRVTGGRAILHAQEITYSITGSSPSELFGSTLHETYMLINKALVNFLINLGLDAEISDGESLQQARDSICFKSAGKHEISIDGKKIIGSAQRRKDGKFLQHGSILCGNAHADLAEILSKDARGNLPKELLMSSTTNLSEIVSIDYQKDFNKLAELLAVAFSEVLELELIEI